MRKASSNESMRPSSDGFGAGCAPGARGSSREQVELQPLHVARRAAALLMYLTWAWSDGHAGVAERRALVDGGRNAELQLLTPPCASVGQMVMNAGRFAFSVPRP